MAGVVNPRGKQPVYNTHDGLAGATVDCDISSLSQDGLDVLSLATTVCDELRAIISTLGGLKSAGAWLGPSSDDAQDLFDAFDTAAKKLFNDQPPGLLATIGCNLRRAALNYDRAESAIAAMFDSFTSGKGGDSTESTSEDGNPVRLSETAET